MIKVGNTIN